LRSPFVGIRLEFELIAGKPDLLALIVVEC
jgi:hypothetical protein